MNLAADIRSQVQTQFPGAVVSARNRRGLEFTLPDGRQQKEYTIWPLHVEGTETEIDTAWIDTVSPQDDPWLKKIVQADFNAFFGPGTQEFDAGQIIEYRHPGSGENVNFQVQQLQWSNDLDQIEPIATPTKATPTITNSELYFAAAFGTDLDFRWKASPAKLAKELIIQQASAIGTPPQFIIDGGNPVLKLGFIFQRSAGLEIWIDGAAWNEKSNNPVETSQNVEFRLASTGEVLWYFDVPKASDSSDPVDEPLTNQIAATQLFRKVALNLIVEVRVPWSWLETAVFPVIVDPTYDVGAGGDDAFNRGAATFDSTNTYCWVGNQAAKSHDSFYRFTGVTFDSEVTAMACTWILANNSVGTGANLIHAEDADNPAAPTTYADFAGRARTTASVAIAPTGTAGDSIVSSSLVSIGEELRASYTISADAVMIIVDDNGSTSNNYAQFATYENTIYNPAQLSVTLAGVGGTILPQMMQHHGG